MIKKKNVKKFREKSTLSVLPRKTHVHSITVRERNLTSYRKEMSPVFIFECVSEVLRHRQEGETYLL